MGQNLSQASYQWAKRPADERFPNLEEMYLHCWQNWQNARASDVPIRRLFVAPQGGNLVLKGTGRDLTFNNWSFGQLATKVGAPAAYLRDLPAELAAENLNHCLQRKTDAGEEVSVWFDQESGQARAVTTPKYGRVGNHDVIAWIKSLPGKWVTPPARPVDEDTPNCRIATADDCGPHTLVKPGDAIADAGLYASDHDMFAFQVDVNTRIDDGSDGGLSRGFFVRNSEVGACSLDLMTFLFRHICGNHIVWDVADVRRVKVRHMGRGVKNRAFDRMGLMLKTYMEHSAKDDEARITAARHFELGKNYDDVLEAVFQKHHILPKKTVEAAYAVAERNAGTDGSPRSAWGFAQGVTRLSQSNHFADERNELDEAASKVIALSQPRKAKAQIEEVLV